MKKHHTWFRATPRLGRTSSRFDSSFLRHTKLVAFEPLEVRRLLDAKVQYLLQAQDPTTHSVITTPLTVGQEFDLALIAIDIRNPAVSSTGVVQGYVDVTFNSNLTSATPTSGNPNPDPKIEFNGTFTNFKSGSLATPGKLLDIGASDLSLNPHDPPAVPQPMWRLRMQALAAGTQTFTTALSTVASHQTLVFLVDEPVLSGDITFTPLSIAVTDIPPVVSIDDASASENVAGGNMVFTITLSHAVSSPVTVVYETHTLDASPTTALSTGAGADFTSKSATATFAPGQTATSISIALIGDTNVENDETFEVHLHNVSGAGATIDPEAELAVGTILNDDLPIITIAVPEPRGEGNQDNSFVYTLTMNTPGLSNVAIPFTTQNGLALAGDDYDGISGTVTFAPGVTSQSITVNIKGDLVKEPNENFRLVFTKPTNATFSTGETTERIVDMVLLNDDGPVVRIDNTEVVHNEDDNGEVDYVFTISILGTVTTDVTVQFATADDSAKLSNDDYVGQSGTLTFNPGGSTSQTVTIKVKGDTLHEADELFKLNLSNISENASLFNSEATGTITNDDAPPLLSITGAATVTEGNSQSETTVVYTVSLSAPSEHPDGVSVSVSTIGKTTGSTDPTLAEGGVDFVELDNEDGDGFIDLFWAPGDSAPKLVTVRIKGDNLHESDETFDFTLFNSQNASNAVPGGDVEKLTITIENDDPIPGASVADVSANEGNAGTTNMVFTVSLSNPSSTEILVSYNTSNGTATAGSDYTATSGTLTFAPNTTTQLVTVAVSGDGNKEASEKFNLNLTAIGDNVTIGDGLGEATITNDDGLPTVSIGNVTQAEGATGTTNFVFTVTLSAANDDDSVIVNFTTVDGTATSADSDFVSQGGTSSTVSFAPGQTTKTITVAVNGDAKNETNETFSVKLTSAQGATIVAGQDTGTGNITNDDAVPTLSIGDVSQNEGGPGATTSFVFTVTLSGASGQAVTVRYETANGTATASTSTANVPQNDYTAATGTLTFAPGTLTQTITISVKGDNFQENAETFLVKLLNPTNATLSDAEATGTIQSETGDTVKFVASKLSGIAFVDINFNGEQDENEGPLANVVVALTGTANDNTSVTRSVTTGTDGKYSFDDLPPGSFSIKYTQPADYLSAVPLGGSENGTATGSTLLVVLPDAGVTTSDTNVFSRGLHGGAISQRNFMRSALGAATVTTVTGPINALNQTAVGASGTGTAGDTITVVVRDATKSTDSKTTTVASNGTWSVSGINATTLTDGTVTFAATATNASGKVVVSTRTTTKDVVNPAGTIVRVDNINSGNATNASAEGTGEVGARVTVVVTGTSGQTAAVNATVGSNGQWSVTGIDTSALPDGNITYLASFVDTAGNSVNQTKTAVKNGSAPEGDFDPDLPVAVNESNQSDFPLRGTGEAGANIKVVVTDSAQPQHTSPEFTTTVKTDGTWELDNVNLSNLSDGQLTFTLTASDAGGSGQQTAIIPKDTVDPVASFQTSPINVNASNDDNLTLNVAVNEAATLVLTISDGVTSHNVTQSTTVPDEGAHTFGNINVSGLNDGTITYTLTATDEAGNVSTISETRQKDVVAPPLTVDPIAAITAGSETAVQVSGTGENGALVSVQATDEDGTSTNTQSVFVANGVWSMTVNVTTLDNGNIRFDFESVDGTGNETPQTVNVNKSGASASSLALSPDDDDSLDALDQSLADEDDWLGE